MKEFGKIEKELGADGKVAGVVGVEDGAFKLEVSASYPVAKVVEPATKAVDSLLDKLEKVIPGDWDKPMIEKLKVEYKEELIKLISE